MAFRTETIETPNINPPEKHKKADIKFHSLLFFYLYCTSQNTNLDRKGTSKYNLSNTGQNLDKQTSKQKKGIIFD